MATTIMKEVQATTLNLFGTELTIEIDPLHVVHILCALLIGITIGNFFDYLIKQNQ